MKLRYVIASAAVLCIANSAKAASITRTFVGNAVFTDGGPVASADFTFGITYDPNGGNFFNMAVDYYTTTSTYSSFNVTPVTFALQGASIYINGNNFGLASFSPDFQLTLRQNSADTTPLISFVAQYTVGNGTEIHNAGDQRLNKLIETSATIPGAVPEPATWAMMIAGFGLVGGTMRRRHGATVRFA